MRPGLTATVLAALALPAGAMEFQRHQTADGGNVVVGLGEIVPGDAGRLTAAFDTVPRDEHRTKQLALHSPGGSVAEAFKMADVIDRVGVTTFIPDGFRCGSACASIVYVAGEYRIVMEGGLLGLHSCYSRSQGNMDQLCNDAIAQHALAHGIAYGDVYAFMFSTAPTDVIWFSADEADCWGLSNWPTDEGPQSSGKGPSPCAIAAIKGEPLPLRHR